MNEKLYMIGVFGHKDRFEPWLLGTEPIEVDNGHLLSAHPSTANLFNNMPFEMRLNPQKDVWLVADMKEQEGDANGYRTAVLFSNDYQRIYTILSGMKFTFDMTFCSGIKLKEKLQERGML